MWFLAEGDTTTVSLNTSRQKTKNLEANHAVNLFILDRQNPYRYLELRGDAAIEPDDDYAFGDRVGAKYSANLRTTGAGCSYHREVVLGEDFTTL